MMNFDLRHRVGAELESGERLLWSGQPDPRRSMIRSIPIVLFGIPWTAFAVFWTAGAAGFTLPDFDKPAELIFVLFPLFGVPFILVGLGMLTSPYWAYRKAQKTLYAVTDRRVLIASFGRSKKVESYFEQDIGDISRTERADGSGDIIFRTEEYTNRRGSQRTKAIGFWAVANVRQVERVMLDTFKHAEKAERTAFS
jgi:hypothetical protein